MAEINTHGVEIPFGKHKGKLLTRVPVGYLRWMVNQSDFDERWRDLARAEFERRGDTMPAVELSGHAIDNASLRVCGIWKETRNDEEEGLYSWLTRMVLEAVKEVTPSPVEDRDGGGRVYIHKGMKLVIRSGVEYPCLVTIMPAKKHKENPSSVPLAEYMSNDTFEIQ